MHGFRREAHHDQEQLIKMPKNVVQVDEIRVDNNFNKIMDDKFKGEGSNDKADGDA